jgi:hypothetical protein
LKPDFHGEWVNAAKTAFTRPRYPFIRNILPAQQKIQFASTFVCDGGNVQIRGRTRAAGGGHG